MQPSTRMLMLACSTTMMAQSGVTLYLPAMPYIATALSMSEAEGYNSLLMYLGGAVAPIILAAPIIRMFGRSAVLLGFCGLFFSASLLSAWACDDTSFYLSRLLQGFGAGGAALIARALLSETFSGARLARSLSLLSYAFVFALMVGQVAGGSLVAFFRWEAVAVVMAFGAFVSAALVLPARQALSELDTDSRRRVRGSGYACLSQPSFYMPVLVGGCGYGVFVVYQGVGVYVFDRLLGWGSTQYGMLGVWLGLAYFLGALTARHALKSMSVHALSMVGVSVLAVAIVLFLLTTLKYMDRHSAIAAYFAVWYAQALMYPCVASMAVKKYPGIESMMLFSFLQQLVALLFGALASLAIPFGMHIVALLALGLGSLGVVMMILLSIKRI
ncbi:MFS transporter [Pseudomonas synxantha]|uniref:MFS transporter n=4 Tax=Pseudomonas TaxID=286 RepID=A0ABS0UNS9_9PSED|nr:MFS transporter [Pseudomonas synxantha]MBI6583243.1 MFS transporter [Pseudomonas synxantha]